MLFRKSVSLPNPKCEYTQNYFRRSYVGVICFGDVPEITELLCQRRYVYCLSTYPNPHLGFLVGASIGGATNESLCQDTLNRMGKLLSEYQIPEFFPNTASLTAKSHAAFA